jgi:hypothetical protein
VVSMEKIRYLRLFQKLKFWNSLIYKNVWFISRIRRLAPLR